MSEICPKCGKPRLEGSLDCPYCGIVYGRFDPGRPRTQAPPPPGRAPAAAGSDGLYRPPAAASGDVYGGTAADGGNLYEGPMPGTEPALPPTRYRARPAAGAPEREPAGRLGALLVENIGLSIVAAVILYGLVSFFWNTQIIVVTEDFDSAAVRFFEISGLPVPEDLDEGGSFRFVGRDYVWFLGNSESVPSVVVLHHRSGLASVRSGTEMSVQIKNWLRELEVPLRELGRRQATLRRLDGEAVEVEILALGLERPAAANLALTPFLAQDGRAALLLIAAPRAEFDALYRLYLQ